jgi:hypothetical protein
MTYEENLRKCSSIAILILQSALVQERNQMDWEKRCCRTPQALLYHLQPMVRYFRGTMLDFPHLFGPLGTTLQFTQIWQHLK